jgi:MFS family permease
VNNRLIEPVWLAHTFIDDLILIYPVYAIMMLGEGVNEFELSVLFVIWALASFAFEIPSGVVADKVDRRRYLFAGSLAGAAGFLVWWLWPIFSGFALGFVLWSLGSAIHSGTQQSLLYDVLHEQNRTSAFARIYGRGKAASSVAVLFAMALGGFLAQNGYPSVLLLSALAPFLSGLLVLAFIREPIRSHSGPLDEASEEQERPFREALLSLRRQPRLRLIALMFIVFVGLSGVVDEYIGPLLKDELNMTLGTIGLIYGAVLGCLAFGNAIAHRLGAVQLSTLGRVSAGSHLLLAAGLALAVHVNVVWLIVSSGLYFFVMGAVQVLLETGLQNEIDVSARATITSVAGAGLEIWVTGLFLAIGALAVSFGWSSALMAVALAAVLISLSLSSSRALSRPQ